MTLLLLCLYMSGVAMPADPHDEDARTTPLMIAAWNGDVSLVKRLIQQGVDVNQTNRYGSNALYYVAGATPTQPLEKGVKGSAEAAHLPLEAGADPNANSRTGGYTALMAAANNRRTDVMEDLLRHGADVNAVTTDGRSALMNAIGRQDAQGVSLLLDGGARVDGYVDRGPAIRRSWQRLQRVRLCGHSHSSVPPNRPTTQFASPARSKSSECFSIGSPASTLSGATAKPL